MGVIGWSGCRGCGEPAEVCPSPATAVVNPLVGDLNADGAVDVSDGVFLHRHLRMAGPPPVCAEAADVIADGHVDGADAFQIWGEMFAGRAPAAVACAAPLTLEDPACGAADLALSVADGAVSVRLTSDLPVSAWAIRVVAEGCTITAATTEGTVGAQAFGAAGGRRGVGFENTAVDGAATSGVVLSWLEEIALDPGEHTLLALTVDDGGACRCTLGFDPAFRQVVTAQGRSYPPTHAALTFDPCP